MARMTVEERAELGKAARKNTPRSAHGEWEPAPDRRDPVQLLAEQNADRLPFLVPVRHARMQVSPFTFYRGAARVMAADLASTPTSGLVVQAGGDAHLSNFGAYASPERQLVFDQNDFDETLPGPWEWDLKRLAASFMIAGQHLGFDADACRRVTTIVTREYRKAMHEFAEMGFLEQWYDYVAVDDVRRAAHLDPAEFEKRLERFRRKATNRTSQQALAKLAEHTDKGWRIRSEPPVLFSLEDAPLGEDVALLEAAALQAFDEYKGTLDDARRAVLDRYEVQDIGVKVVGVGSVGTRCMLMLLTGRDDNDPLFLQAKEATASVLEEFLGASRYDNHGRRVVEGQRLVQAQSDVFLGWTDSKLAGRHYYVRQLRDWKGSVEVEEATPDQLAFYAGLCGPTLARGHARSGDAEAIRSYIGRGDTLDKAITQFAERYAAQNLADYGRFSEAIRTGEIEAAEALPD